MTKTHDHFKIVCTTLTQLTKYMYKTSINNYTTAKSITIYSCTDLEKDQL